MNLKYETDLAQFNIFFLLSNYMYEIYNVKIKQYRDDQ